LIVDVVFCTKCGFEIVAESSKFCSKCGTTILSNSEQKKPGEIRKYRTAKIVIGVLLIMNGLGGFIIQLEDKVGYAIGGYKIVLILNVIWIIIGILIVIGKGSLEKKLK